MKDTNLDKSVQELEKKVQLLLKEYNYTKVALERMTAENDKLKAVIKEQKQQLSGFDYHQKIGQIAETLEKEQNPEVLKRKIDEYIEKIDNCISYLNAQL